MNILKFFQIIHNFNAECKFFDWLLRINSNTGGFEQNFSARLFLFVGFRTHFFLYNNHIKVFKAFTNIGVLSFF